MDKQDDDEFWGIDTSAARPTAKLKGRKQRKPGTWCIIDSLPWTRAAREALRGCEAGTMMVVIYLQGRYAMDDRNPIVVSNETMAALGVSRWTRTRALDLLEGAGLILVERVSRRSPRVTLIPVGA